MTLDSSYHLDVARLKDCTINKNKVKYVSYTVVMYIQLYDVLCALNPVIILLWTC